MQVLEFGTFEFLLKSQFPKGRKALTSKVVYYQKINKKGKIIKLKARLVVRGCWDLVPNSLFIPPIRGTYPDRSLLFWS